MFGRLTALKYGAKIGLFRSSPTMRTSQNSEATSCNSKRKREREKEKVVIQTQWKQVRVYTSCDLLYSNNSGANF